MPLMHPTYKNAARQQSAYVPTSLGFADEDETILRGCNDSAAGSASSPVAVARSLAATDDSPIEADSARAFLEQ